MMMLASVLLCLTAFGALALSLPRHHRDALGAAPPPGRERRLRLLGWCLLGVSLLPLILGFGEAIGGASWFGAASLSGLAVMALLAYRPRAIVPATLASAPLALAAICLSGIV